MPTRLKRQVAVAAGTRPKAGSPTPRLGLRRLSPSHLRCGAWRCNANSARWARHSGGPHRSGVTLIELLFVMMILAILGAVAFGGFSAAAAQARVERTRAIISKLDQLITAKYESYRTRAVPIKINPGTRPIGEPFTDTPADSDLTNGIRDGAPYFATSAENFLDLNSNNQYDMGAAEYRLLAIRELMRFELPNLKADVVIDPLVIGSQQIFPRPALNKNYVRRANSIPGGIAAWTEQYEGAECLYMIVAAMHDGEDSALDFFAPQEIGDLDGDGMNEIHDAWGNPIEFVRWPTGYSEHPGNDGAWGVAGVDDDNDGIQDNPTEAGWIGSDDILPPPTPQTRNSKKAPDPFDPLKVDGRYRLPNSFITPFALKPLIYSPGPDKEYDVQKLSIPNPTALKLLDPYRVEFGSTPPRLSAGSPFDPDGAAGFADNITNHDFSEK
jgi:prepilin-type N-terminal cleavage/methylation domain-containing protein